MWLETSLFVLFQDGAFPCVQPRQAWSFLCSSVWPLTHTYLTLASMFKLIGWWGGPLSRAKNPFWICYSKDSFRNRKRGGKKHLEMSSEKQPQKNKFMHLFCLRLFFIKEHIKIANYFYWRGHKSNLPILRQEWKSVLFLYFQDSHCICPLSSHALYSHPISIARSIVPDFVPLLILPRAPSTDRPTPLVTYQTRDFTQWRVHLGTLACFPFYSNKGGKIKCHAQDLSNN